MEISDLEQFGHSTPRGFKRALHKLENMAQQKTQSGLINSNAEVDGNLLITKFFSHPHSFSYRSIGDLCNFINCMLPLPDVSQGVL